MLQENTNTVELPFQKGADIPEATKKGQVVVNVAKLNPETPVPLDFNTTYFTISATEGSRYLPFGKDDSFPNLMWEARLQSLTQNACITSIAQTCVGSGIYVTNVEPDLVDKDFLTWINRINDNQSLKSIIKLGMECEETDGNAWGEIVKGAVGGTKYVKAYMHSSLICRFGAIPKDKDKPEEIIKSTRFAEKRGRVLSARQMKGIRIPIYSSNPLDKAIVWSSDEINDLHTCIHIKNENPASLFYGMQRSVANLRDQVLEGKSAQYDLDNFENNMVISAILVLKSPMTQAEAKLVAQDIIKTHTGAGRNGRVAVISSEQGIEEWDLKTLDTQKEGSFLESRKVYQGNIIVGCNWDAIFFGQSSESSLGKGSTYVRAVYDIKKTTVIDPLCEHWLNSFVYPLIKIAAEHMGKPEWLKYQLAFETAMPFSYSSDIDVNAVLTKNEGREILGMPKSENPEWDKEPIKGGAKEQKPKEDVPTEPVA